MVTKIRPVQRVKAAPPMIVTVLETKTDNTIHEITVKNYLTYEGMNTEVRAVSP